MQPPQRVPIETDEDGTVRATAIVVPISWIWPIIVVFVSGIFAIEHMMDVKIETHTKIPYHAGAKALVEEESLDIEKRFARMEALNHGKDSAMASDVKDIKNMISDFIITLESRLTKLETKVEALEKKAQ